MTSLDVLYLPLFKTGSTLQTAAMSNGFRSDVGRHVAMLPPKHFESTGNYHLSLSDKFGVVIDAAARGRQMYLWRLIDKF